METHDSSFQNQELVAGRNYEQLEIHVSYQGTSIKLSVCLWKFLDAERREVHSKNLFTLVTTSSDILLAERPKPIYVDFYCLTKISIRAKRSISRVFSLFIVPSPFFVHCPYKGRINRAESVLTGLKPY